MSSVLEEGSEFGGLGWPARVTPEMRRQAEDLIRGAIASGEFPADTKVATRKAGQTVPAGVPSVSYQVQGTRSTSVGVAAEFVVNFGVGAGGTLI